MDNFETYTTTLPGRSHQRSSEVAGATLHPAIYPTVTTPVHDTLISFLSFIKTKGIPVLPVAKPDIRSGLGQGASFIVNGAEMPEDYDDHITGVAIPKGTIVAFKRAILHADMEDPTADRIRVIFNELITMHHPPLMAHPNIVRLLGVAFETEGPSDSQNAMPVLVPECAEPGNLAEVLENARKEGRALSFDDKISMCLDVAYGLEILHACDVVHGDVKCENILVFDREKGLQGEHEPSSDLICKLTDFGVFRLPGNQVMLGGSRPWQAPECSRGAFFKVEEAKRTDIYSFGMLVWRVALDGDPFKLLGEFGGKTSKERRDKRNEAVAALKTNDQLVQHACQSLAMSEALTRPQLDMLCEVISVTLVQDSSRRELDVTRLIRLLSKNQWYEARHPMAPARIPLDIDAHFLDMEKWYHEFARISPVVHSLIVDGFRESVHYSPTGDEKSSEHRKQSASYQLAVCYANGVGTSFSPGDCLGWLAFATNLGSEKAYRAHCKIAEAFSFPPIPFTDPWSDSHEPVKLDQSFRTDSYDSLHERLARAPTGEAPQISRIDSDIFPTEASFLAAAEGCHYGKLATLLSANVKPTTSKEGVSTLHFTSLWDIAEARALVPKLMKAGADINAVAERGSTVGGTPLMWAIHGDHHIEHTKLLIENGADPFVSLEDGENAFTLAARTHATLHLRILLINVRPIQLVPQFAKLMEEALGASSRFARLVRHGKQWKEASKQTLQLLEDWDILYSGADHFMSVLISSLEKAAKSTFARMNTDILMTSVRLNELQPTHLEPVLRTSVLNYDKALFDALLGYAVSATSTFEHKKSLLHLCAKIPDHSVAASDFAPQIIALGGDIHARDDYGLTPWMDAILERKWDLADLLMKEGADPLATDNEGFNVLGLCIKAINIGSIKYLLKYCAKATIIQDQSFIVNEKSQISAIQLASTLPLPRSHGMKNEVVGTFHNIFAYYGLRPAQIHHRSKGIMPELLGDATALDIASALGHVYAVKSLVKRLAHHEGDGSRAIGHARAALKKLDESDTSLKRQNLQRCIFIIENWDSDAKGVRKIADDWTNMKTIDESNIPLSWEMVVFDYKSRKGI